MSKRKVFSDEEKLQILMNALQLGDIRDILNNGIHRKHIIEIASDASRIGLISPDEYDSIAAKISRPLAFPSDTEKRLESILAGAINTEPKQIVTLLLRAYPQAADQLRDEFVISTSGVWRPRNLKNNIEDYLLLSLDPIGFVSFPIISQGLDEVIIGHNVTEAGRRYGQPLSSFALKLVNEVGISLCQVLGSTSSHGDSRGPYNRFRILESLLTGDKRFQDLSRELNLHSSGIRGHLEALKEQNLVDFDSVSTEERGWAVYEWTHGKVEDVQPIARSPTLTTQVAEYLFKHKKSECNDITDHLLEKEAYKNWKRSALSKNVSTMLVGIAKQGFAIAKYQGSIEMSHVSITQNKEGIEFVTEFTTKIRDALQDGSELSAMEELKQAYSVDPALFQKHATNALRFYIQVSPQINKKPSETRISQIFDYVSKAGEARTTEIQRALGNTARRYLTGMVAEGTLKKEKRGRATVYQVKS